MNLNLKNKILIVCFIASLFIVYRFAVSNTIEARKVVSDLTKEKILLTNVSSKIATLKAKELQLDKILKKKNISIHTSFQQALLQNVSSFAKKNKLQIIAFNQPHLFNTNITKLHTYSFEVRGHFNSLLKLTNHLENLQLGKLVSIKFEKKKDFRKNTSFLTCNVLLQRVGN